MVLKTRRAPSLPQPAITPGLVRGNRVPGAPGHLLRAKEMPASLGNTHSSSYAAVGLHIRLDTWALPQQPLLGWLVFQGLPASEPLLNVESVHWEGIKLCKL